MKMMLKSQVTLLGKKEAKSRVTTKCKAPQSVWQWKATTGYKLVLDEANQKIMRDNVTDDGDFSNILSGPVTNVNLGSWTLGCFQKIGKPIRQFSPTLLLM